MAVKRIAKEYADLEKSGFLEENLGCLHVTRDVKDPYHWDIAYICPDMYLVNGAPRPSPYAGQLYRFRITFPRDYPFNVFKIECEEAFNWYHPLGKCPPSTMAHAMTDKWSPAITAAAAVQEYLLLPFSDISKATAMIIDHHGDPVPPSRPDGIEIVDDHDPPAETAITIHIRTLTGRNADIRCSRTETVEVLKGRIEAAVGIPAGEQRLVYDRRQLLDMRTLDDAGLIDDCTVFVVLRLRCDGLCMTNADAIKLFETDIDSFEAAVRSSF